MIARIWHGILKSKSQAAEYAEYMSQTGVKDLQATQRPSGRNTNGASVVLIEILARETSDKA